MKDFYGSGIIAPSFLKIDDSKKRMTYDMVLNIILHMNDTDAETQLQKLFEKGIDPNIHTPTEHSLIFYASLHYRHRLVKLLLENGADPNVPARNQILSNADSPLEFLLRLVYSVSDYDKIKENRLKTIQLLLDYSTYITKTMLQSLIKEKVFLLRQPVSLQTLCKFTVVNDLKLNLRDLIDNRIIPASITYVLS
jgi:hypothetical protein